MITTLLAAAAIAAAPASSELSAGALRGTLVQPTGKARAAVLIIPGSGPTDRDGNNPLGGKANSYRLLAEELVTKGVATVRIDKRGLGGSQAVGNGNQVTVAEYVTDTRAWIAATRSATGLRCVWLAGHSEGGLVALASAGEKDVCGLVLLATGGRPLGRIIREQLRANPANAPILPQAEVALASLEAGRRADVSAMHPALAQGLFNPSVQDFLIDIFRRDPVQLLRSYSGPVLVVSGGRDLQVGKADADALAAARAGVATAVFPAMNHVLKDAPEDRAGNMATYADPTRPLTVGLADRIAAFVTGARR
jgi:pimeloyl-ACP methyl ester carboxylesterase